MLWKRTFFDLAGLLAFSLAVGLIGARCWSLLRPADQPNHPTRAALADFQDVVYYPTRAVLARINPYDARPPSAGGAYFSKFPAGNAFPLYSPLIFFFSLPFAVLPLTAAEITWWLFNLALLLVFSGLALRLAKLPCRVGSVTLVAAALLLSRPGHANFYFGALALPLSLATFGAWSLADRRPWLSSVCLAISCIKPTFGGPLVVLMLLRGHYRAAAYGVVLTCVANLMAFAAFLPAEFTNPNPLEILAHNQAATDHDPAVDPLVSSTRVDLPFVVERLYGRHFPSYIRLSLTFLVLVVAGWHLRLLGQSQEILSTALACVTIVICMYHNIYDALLVAFAAAAAWGAIAEKVSPNRRLFWPILVCLAIPALNYFNSQRFLALLADQGLVTIEWTTSPALWTAISTLNAISLTAAGCLLLVMVRRELGRRDAPLQPG